MIRLYWSIWPRESTGPFQGCTHQCPHKHSEQDWVWDRARSLRSIRSCPWGCDTAGLDRICVVRHTHLYPKCLKSISINIISSLCNFLRIMVNDMYMYFWPDCFDLSFSHVYIFMCFLYVLSSGNAYNYCQLTMQFPKGPSSKPMPQLILEHCPFSSSISP